MLEKPTRIMTENLARAIGRRSFLKSTGQVMFGGLAALASGHLLEARQAFASGGPVPRPLQPECAPPGPYCNTGSGMLSGCHGSSCFEHLYNGSVLQCRVYYEYYSAGCWTTPT